jgi:hypothetical protein
MIGYPQLAIAIGTLGMMITLLGLFPGITGVETGQGIGALQFSVIWTGLMLVHVGALMFVRFTYYAGRKATLAQQIGIRLSFTGLLIVAITGLADYLGFGSHSPYAGQIVRFGPLQIAGILGGLLIASLGVFIYALSGSSDEPPD